MRSATEENRKCLDSIIEVVLLHQSTKAANKENIYNASPLSSGEPAAMLREVAHEI